MQTLLWWGKIKDKETNFNIFSSFERAAEKLFGTQPTTGPQRVYQSNCEPYIFSIYSQVSWDRVSMETLCPSSPGSTGTTVTSGSGWASASSSTPTQLLGSRTAPPCGTTQIVRPDISTSVSGPSLLMCNYHAGWGGKRCEFSKFLGCLKSSADN